jgi:hypothetical protein
MPTCHDLHKEAMLCPTYAYKIHILLPARLMTEGQLEQKHHKQQDSELADVHHCQSHLCAFKGEKEQRVTLSLGSRPGGRDALIRGGIYEN